MQSRLIQLRAEIDQRRAEIADIKKRLEFPHVTVIAKYWRHWSEYEDEYDSVNGAISVLEAMSDAGDIGEHHVYVGGAEIIWDAGLWSHGQPVNWTRH